MIIISVKIAKKKKNSMTQFNPKTKTCPQCGKTIGYHYSYTSSAGVFCDDMCCEKYEKEPKMKKTFENLEKLELLTRQISNDLRSQQHYDLTYFGENLANYAEWIEKETKKIKEMEK